MIVITGEKYSNLKTTVNIPAVSITQMDVYNSRCYVVQSRYKMLFVSVAMVALFTAPTWTDMMCPQGLALKTLQFF